ncbi:MAG: hypothetical protein M3P34_10980 [Actinomycetota bacterium]|nr:hypothetical protein [Actinomycetota bacterium]
MRAILERCPHPGARPAAELVDVAITEQRTPLLTLSDNGFAKFLLGDERSYQPALVAPLLGHHLCPVSFVRHGLMIADDGGERR